MDAQANNCRLTELNQFAGLPTLDPQLFAFRNGGYPKLAT